MPKSYLLSFNIWPLGLIFIIGLAVFLNGLSGNFIYDDHIVLSHSLFDQPSRMFNFFSEPYFEDFAQAGLYRPLTQISFAFNFLFSSSPFGFHLVNVILHIFNSFLIFILLKKLVGSARVGFLSSVLFLVLPIHVEAVTSIVGRAELLSLFFSLLAVLFYLNSKLVISSLFFFATLLSKEISISLLAIIFVLSLYQRGGFRWISYYAISLLFFLNLRFFVLGSYALGIKPEFVFNPLVGDSFWERIPTALKVFTLYIQKTLIPYNLSSDYSYNQIAVENSIFNPLSFAGILMLVFLLSFLVILITKRKNILFAFAASILIFPYLIISNIFFITGTVMAERLMYIPSLGLVIIISLFFSKFFDKFKKPAILAFLVLIFSFSFLTIPRNRIWASEEKFFSDMYKNSPDSIVAKTNWAKILFESDKKEAKDLALESYNQYPDFIPNLNLLAMIEKREGNFEKAEVFLERAQLVKPKHQETLVNLSRLYFIQRKYKMAEEVLNQLVELYQGEGNIILLAITKTKLRKNQEAIALIREHFGEDSNMVNNFLEFEPTFLQ